MTEQNIKFIVCYHKPSKLINDPLYVPVNVGRALLDQKVQKGLIEASDKNWLLAYTIGDDTGENISYLNNSYCELTGIYWAWKNYDKLNNPEYIGLCHYRRLFDVDSHTINDFIRDNEIIYAGVRDDHNEDLTVLDQFIMYHKLRDLEICLEYLKKHCSFYDDVKEYFEQPFYKSSICNMFLVKKEIFFEYCEFIFDLLKNLESKFNLAEYSCYGSRLFGFLAERFTGAFFYHKKINGIKVKKEIPFFFGEKYLKVKYKDFSFDSIKYKLNNIKSESSELDKVYIAMPIKKDNINLSFSTLKSCLIYGDQSKHYIFYLVTNADSIHANLDNLIQSKICELLCYKKKFSAYVVDVSDTFLYDYSISDSLYSLKNSPSAWFLFLNKEITGANNIIWLDSGIVFNCDVSKLYNFFNDNYALTGSESYYQFVYEQNLKKINDIDIDFSLTNNYMQTSYMLINLDKFEFYKNKIIDKLIQNPVNKSVYLNLMTIRKMCSLLDYSWSVEYNLQKDFKDTVKRLSFDSFMSFSSSKKHYKGMMFQDFESVKVTGID